jgi:hypothetical protein
MGQLPAKCGHSAAVVEGWQPVLQWTLNRTILPVYRLSALAAPQPDAGVKRPCQGGVERVYLRTTNPKDPGARCPRIAGKGLRLLDGQRAPLECPYRRWPYRT